MTLDTNAVMLAGGSHDGGGHSGHGSSGSSTRLSTPGCAMLATLLTLYPRKVAKPWAASVAGLPAADAARAARDPAGSRALQALLEGGGASAEARSGLLAALDGAWGGISLLGAGSHLLEHAYAWAVCV
jgi:hypothetical protein